MLIACSLPSLPVVNNSDILVNDDPPPELIVWADDTVVLSMETDPKGAGRYGFYLIEQFQKEHPDVTLKIEYHGWDEELRQNFGKAILDGTAPDVIVGENIFQQYAKDGQLLALDDEIADIKDNLIEGTYKAAVYNDKIYGLSGITGVFSFERNCQVIEAAGLDCSKPPQTWNELLKQAKIITEQGQDEYYGYTLQGASGFSVGGIFRIAVYLTQANAPMCKDNCTYPWFDNPKAIPVMEFLREINKQTPPGLIFQADEEFVYTRLFEGKSAYQIAGSWHVDWAKAANCTDCRYSSVPIPKNGRQASIIVGNVIYAIYKESKQPDLAVDFIKLVLRDDVQAKVHSQLRRLPSTKSALERLRPNVDNATKTYIDELLNNPNLDILPQWQKHPKQLWGIYNEMVTRVLLTNEPIDKIMVEAQTAADELVGK